MMSVCEVTNKERIKIVGFKLILKNIIKLVAFVTITLVICRLLTDKVMYFTEIKGTSMESTIENEDLIFVSRISDIDRGDIIVFDLPYAQLVKRVVALPGDSIYINDGKLYVNNMLVEEPYIKQEDKMSAGHLGRYITLGEGEYIVLGDNRALSVDSRQFGVVKEEYIVGKVVASTDVLKKIAIFDQLSPLGNLLIYMIGITIILGIMRIVVELKFKD